MIISAMYPSNKMYALSSMSACVKALGMSDSTMYLPSFASIAHDNTIASRDTVGEITSSFVVYCH